MTLQANDPCYGGIRRTYFIIDSGQHYWYTKGLWRRVKCLK